jgi:hypothetical protein
MYVTDTFLIKYMLRHVLERKKSSIVFAGWSWSHGRDNQGNAMQTEPIYVSQLKTN